MYEKKYVDYLGHKGIILLLSNGDRVYYDLGDELSPAFRRRFRNSIAKSINLHHGVYRHIAPWADISKICYACPGIKKVIFNEPATIVIWDDGTKTVVKCSEGDTYSEWSGLAFCICKKLMGDEFHKVFKHWCDRDDIREPIYDVRHTDPGETSESMFSLKNVIQNAIEASSKISEIFEEALKLK